MRDDRGFTLVEMLVAMLVSFIIFSATLAAFEAMANQRRQVEEQTEVESVARRNIDRLARQLRNLASPSDVVTDVAASTQPKSVDRNLPADLIFKDVADARPAGSANPANVRRVRYCLQSSGPVPGTSFSASATRQVLWMQTQTWTTASPPAVPASTACPGTGWTTRSIVADRVVNTPAKPLFVYTGDAGVVTGTDDADRERIARVSTLLELDADPTRNPAATGLKTAVMLRNQNRAPVARFSYTLLNQVTCLVQLNGSTSEDPESKPLEYEWYVDGVKLGANESGVVVQKTVTRGAHRYSLRVYDRAHLVGVTPEETYTC